MIDRAVLPTITHTLNALGAHVRGKRASGICHSSETAGVISFDDDRGVYYCHRCAAGGDVITLVMRARDLDYRGAMQWLGITPGRPPAPDPEAIRRQRARAGLQAWARATGRKLRAEFLARERVALHARERLERDPEDEEGWSWLQWALSGQAHLEHMLDVIDTGTEAQQMEAYQEMRRAAA